MSVWMANCAGGIWPYVAQCAISRRQAGFHASLVLVMNTQPVMPSTMHMAAWLTGTDVNIVIVAIACAVSKLGGQ